MEKSQPVQGYLCRDGFTLGYQIEGEGDPLLVIGSHVFYPRVFSKDLRRTRQLIFVDHRGFAHADRAIESRDCTLETIMDDLSALCSALNLTRVDVGAFRSRVYGAGVCTLPSGSGSQNRGRGHRPQPRARTYGVWRAHLGDAGRARAKTTADAGSGGYATPHRK